MENTLHAVLRHKGAAVTSAGPDTTVTQAAATLADNRVGALLVLDEDGGILGIVSERDIVWQAVALGLDPNKTRVTDVMTRDPSCATPDMTVEQAMAFMSGKRFRHLPVVENGRLAGIVSIGDLTAWVMDDQEHTIGDLMKYIYDDRA